MVPNLGKAAAAIPLTVIRLHTKMVPIELLLVGFDPFSQC